MRVNKNVMKIEGLRIGNYLNGVFEQEIDRGNGIIEDVECEELVSVVGLDSVGFSEYYIWVDGYDREEYDSFSPIPLSKQWMLDLGFKQLDKYTFVYKGWFIHYRVKEGSFIYNKRTKVEYVHQLQNLLFFLSGYELKLEV